MARDMGIKVVERHIKEEELADAKDAFLTGSAAEITRIGAIADKYFYPQISDLTLQLIEGYKKLVHNVDDEEGTIDL